MALIKITGLVTKYKVLGRGKPLVLLHGWGGSSESFSHLQKTLSRRYRAISLDLPGFGETDFPPRAWRVEDYAQFVRTFAQKLGIETYCLVGHSFGGRIAILLASSYPLEVKDLVLISAAGIKREHSPEERAIGFVAKLGRRMMSLPFVNRFEEPVRYMFYKLIRRQDYYLAKGIMRETIQNIIAKDLTPYLSRIHIPTLIIWGDKDTITPVQDAYTMKQEIKGSKLKIVARGTHYLPRKNYQELSRYIMRFLR